MYQCICDCGNIVDVRGGYLKKAVHSCGCLQRDSRRRDIAPGTKYERLTVIDRTDLTKHNAYMYRCICDCGKEILVRSDMLRTGSVRSCGCLHDELLRANSKKANIKNSIDGTYLPRIKSTNLSKNNTSGVKGVRWSKPMDKWRASITFKGKDYHLGYYDDLDKATMIRRTAEEELFGGFLKWYEESKKTVNEKTEMIQIIV